MKIREIAYRFMSDQFLSARAKVLYEKLDKAKDSKERMKIVEENFDILEALIHKHRDDKEFINTVRMNLEDVIEYGKKILNENKKES